MNIQKQNPIELGRKDGVFRTVQQDKLNAKQNNLSLKLDQYKIDELIECLPPRANQARRLVKLVAENPNSITGSCNRVAGVNISDIALKYNRYMQPKGYELKCKLPSPLIKNKYGEDTMQHLWALYPVSGEA